MHTLAPDKIIPSFPLGADPVTGNKLFRINKITDSVTHIPAEFLLPHRKEYYFMVLVRKGQSRHWVDTARYTLQHNTFYFTVPHQVHLKEEPEPLTAISIAFTAEFLSMMNEATRQLPIIQNPQNAHELILSADDRSYLEELMEKIYAEYHTRSDWQYSMLIAYMQVLLIYLSRLYNEQFSNNEFVEERLLLKNFLGKIEERYTSVHDVSGYAEMLNISAGHLGEVVKQQSGKPAIAHIHERLMIEAKRLLFHTAYSVKEIAFMLGFEDTSYFNRFFKRNSSLTPVAYRTTTREMYH